MPGSSPSTVFPRVLIVLGTHNGAAYLPELLQSIQQQSYAAWQMLARDDASTDGTKEFLTAVAGSDPRVEIMANAELRQGVAANFGTLLKRAAEEDADYVFLADQDDVWQRERIRKQLELMLQSESSLARRTPVLVYSDLSVVDARLRTIHGSFYGHAGFAYQEGRPLETLLAHNIVPGCAMLLNRPLLDFVVPVPPEVPVHDWWVALCAAAVGRLVPLSEPLLLYRQHGRNLVGAPKRWPLAAPWRADWGRRWQRARINFERHLLQTAALRQRLDQRKLPCEKSTRQLLEEFCGVFETPGSAIGRMRRLRELGLPKTTPLRRWKFFVRALTARGR